MRKLPVKFFLKGWMAGVFLLGCEVWWRDSVIHMKNRRQGLLWKKIRFFGRTVDNDKLTGLKTMGHSYVLKMVTENGESFLFRRWIKKPSRSAEFSQELRYARHWKDKTNAERFRKRNLDVLGNFEVFKVIRKRYCDYCGTLIDKQMKTSAKFCSEECRKKSHKENQ